VTRLFSRSGNIANFLCERRLLGKIDIYWNKQTNEERERSARFHEVNYSSLTGIVEPECQACKNGAAAKDWRDETC
jgi:hypothetical protein